jgi:Uma2 family endonuclease
MSTQPQARYSPAEYLAIERASEIKHEYYAGEIFAMGGASREHNRVTFNLAVILGAQLKEKDCEAFVNDMRVKISKTGLYTYPDLIVTCEHPRFEDDQFDTLLNPQVIIEVLSDSTEKYDRGKKFAHYRRVESLREYVLVSQDRPLVEHYARQDDGHWLLTVANGLEATVELPTVDCRLRLADVYAKVEFPPEESAGA